MLLLSYESTRRTPRVHNIPSHDSQGIQCVRWAALPVWDHLSNAASFVLCAFDDEDHHNLLHYTPRLNNTCVLLCLILKKTCIRQEVFDEWLPLRLQHINLIRDSMARCIRRPESLARAGHNLSQTQCGRRRPRCWTRPSPRCPGFSRSLLRLQCRTQWPYPIGQSRTVSVLWVALHGQS